MTFRPFIRALFRHSPGKAPPIHLSFIPRVLPPCKPMHVPKLMSHLGVHGSSSNSSCCGSMELQPAAVGRAAAAAASLLVPASIATTSSAACAARVPPKLSAADTLLSILQEVRMGVRPAVQVDSAADAAAADENNEAPVVRACLRAVPATASNTIVGVKATRAPFGAPTCNTAGAPSPAEPHSRVRLPLSAREGDLQNTSSREGPGQVSAAGFRREPLARRQRKRTGHGQWSHCTLSQPLAPLAAC